MGNKDVEMEDGGSQSHTRKRRLDEEDDEDNENWKKAKSTDDKLGVIFEVLTTIKQDGRDQQKQITEMISKVEQLEEEVATLKDEKAQYTTAIAEMEEKVKFVLQGGQQSLVLHGVKEVPSENTKQLVEQLFSKVFGSSHGISTAYRIGNANPSGKLIKIKMTSQDLQQSTISKGNMDKVKQYNSANKTRLLLLPDSTFSERMKRKQTKTIYDNIKSTDADAKLHRGIIHSGGAKYSVGKDGKVTKLK